MAESTISVIIPCYNQGQYIDDAVSSVLAQTYQDFEIIIVDDGSTDDFTKQKLINYKSPKTKIIHTHNKGLAGARNTGYKNATGKFIQFLDSDDIISPTKFEEQLASFSIEPDVDICYTSYKIYDIQNNNYIKLPEKKFLGEEPLTDFLFKWERGLSIPIHCALFRKSALGPYPPFNEDLRAKEDWLMWCRLAAYGKRFCFLDKEYAIYRFHDKNMSKDVMEMSYNTFLAAYYIVQIIPENIKNEFLRETIVKLNKILEISLYPNLVNEISDLKNKFLEMDKTIDYRIGNLLMKPYRLIKKVFFGWNYLCY